MVSRSGDESDDTEVHSPDSNCDQDKAKEAVVIGCTVDKKIPRKRRSNSIKEEQFDNNI